MQLCHPQPARHCRHAGDCPCIDALEAESKLRQPGHRPLLRLISKNGSAQKTADTDPGGDWPQIANREQLTESHRRFGSAYARTDYNKTYTVGRFFPHCLSDKCGILFDRSVLLNLDQLGVEAAVTQITAR